MKTTRKMNSQGIGLGLVITKMLTQEFGGETKVFSVYKNGSIFQSSFEIPSQEKEHKADGEEELSPQKSISCGLNIANELRLAR